MNRHSKQIGERWSIDVVAASGLLEIRHQRSEQVGCGVG